MEHLARLLGRTPPAASGTPFLTYYDDATGERTELSYATTDNWVAKTANFLRDGLDVQPGDGVTVVLPPHWLAVVVTFAAWLAGCPVGAGGTVVGEDLPSLAGEVLAYGDRFVPSGPVTAPEVEPREGRILVVDEDPVPFALAALAGGGGIVICRNADPALLERRAQVEHARPH